MNGPNTNKWKVLKKFCTSWWGVISIVIASIATAVTTSVAIGSKVMARMSLPAETVERVMLLESYDGLHDDLHASQQRFRDSVFAVLVSADKKIGLFFDLYRCTEAGYDAHNCPLMSDELGVEPLAPAEARTLVPSPGPNN